MQLKHSNMTAQTAVRQPLAALLRPTSLANFYGQQHLLAVGMPLANCIATGQLPAMLLWGPPGSGKTTLANLLAQTLAYELVVLSATSAGVKEIKELKDRAENLWLQQEQRVLVFLDEIHRFNKAQQDALLPLVENGIFTLIGATTENPAFAINNALLSRLIVYQLQQLTQLDLQQILNHALQYLATKNIKLSFDPDLVAVFIALADSDARKLLNNLELLTIRAGKTGQLLITKEILSQVLTVTYRKFDKGGDVFYEQISALHKSVRGSHPDAALYWLARMLDGGCDPLYIARRVVRMAAEDIGNADPRGLELAVAAFSAYKQLGSPEGDLAIAQAVCYLAVAPKSNAVYSAFNAALQDAKSSGSLAVPLHLRNAPREFMRDLGYGAAYQYDPDVAGGVALDQHYFPDNFKEKIYYAPREQGLEAKIKAKLDDLRKQRSNNC